MKITIKATKMELTDAIKNAVYEKVGSLEKFFDRILGARVEVGLTTNHHQKGDIFFCNIDLQVPGKNLRTREQTEELYVAINKAKDVMQREIKRYKEKMSV